MALNSMDVRIKSNVDMYANTSKNLCFSDYLPKN